MVAGARSPGFVRNRNRNRSMKTAAPARAPPPPPPLRGPFMTAGDWVQSAPEQTPSPSPRSRVSALSSLLMLRDGRAGWGPSSRADPARARLVGCPTLGASRPPPTRRRRRSPMSPTAPAHFRAPASGAPTRMDQPPGVARAAFPRPKDVLTVPKPRPHLPRLQETAPKTSTMQIFVKTLTGKTITLEVEASRHHRQRQGQDPGQGGHPSRPAAPDLRGQAARGRPHARGLQHPEGVDAAPGAAPARRDADLRQDADRQDHHARGRGSRHHRQRQGQDPGQGGHPSGPAAPDLRGQAARGRPHAADYNIQKESTLHLVLRLRGGMQIFVKTLTGKTITLEVEAGDTIDERQGQDPGQGGHPARPAAPDLRGQAARGRPHAADYNIQKESTLHLVLRLRGGMQIFVKTLTGKTITLEVEASRHHRQRQGQDPGQGGHPSGPAAPDLRGQAARGRPHAAGLQHPEGVDAAPGAPPARRDADLRQDPDRQDHHPRGRGRRHHRQRQGQDPGQGGHPAGPAAPDLRGQAARGRPHAADYNIQKESTLHLVLRLRGGMQIFVKTLTGKTITLEVEASTPSTTSRPRSRTRRASRRTSSA